VRGGDARKYLQGLITNDIGKAQGAAAIHAGLLSPQGKILFDFFIVPEGDGFLIDVAQEKTDELQKRLTFYRLRAQVEIAAEPRLPWRRLGAKPLACLKVPPSTPTRVCRSWASA
jgi:folate-binding Fe-S cluster repair protein YgfZ